MKAFPFAVICTLLVFSCLVAALDSAEVAQPLENNSLDSLLPVKYAISLDYAEAQYSRRFANLSVLLLDCRPSFKAEQGSASSGARGSNVSDCPRLLTRSISCASTTSFGLFMDD